MVEPCRIETLGGLRVTSGERTITRFRTRKIGSLLAFLSYFPETPHTRDFLIEMLWPECDPAAGRNRLSMALSSLRSQLEPPGATTGSVILAERTNVRMRSAAIVTDVQEFEAAVRLAETTTNSSDRSFNLEAAASLYAGPLLPGFDEEWVFGERERLAVAHLGVLRKLIRIYAKNREMGRAIDCAIRAVQADPLWEESHRDLARLYLAAGRATAAQRQLEELMRILTDELGDKPSAATLQLMREVLASLNETVSKPSNPKSKLAGTTYDPAGHQPIPMVIQSSPIPTGTVTFLLTDIEGSTALWEKAGEAFKSVLAEHHSILRGCFRKYGGHEVKEAGDSFLVAFGAAADALDCAIAAQKAVSGISCKVDGHFTDNQQPSTMCDMTSTNHQLKVRMALHSGDVEMKDGDYHSLVLHHASRLLSAAQGGQVLCSEATAGLVRRFLEPGITFVDLGLYRLRDVSGAERILQVNYADMPQRQFPPIQATGGHANLLPMQFTRFFGRDTEIDRLVDLLLIAPDGAPDAASLRPRLITLTGPGGAGKTRLSLEVGSRLLEAYEGAAWFVPLADLSDPNLIPGAVLDSMQIPRGTSAEPMAQVVQALLRSPSLLILDNFEHLLEGGAQLVKALVEQAPSVRCLVSSRALLGLAAEREFAVAPLPVPGGTATPEQLLRCDSVRLFVDRAQASKPDFQVTANNAAAVAELCDRLEGLPLALELAAARAQVMTAAQMLEQLNNRFGLLTSRRRDIEERHRTMRAAVEWSYALLDSDLQQLYTRLSVFRGGFTVAAVEAVCWGQQERPSIVVMDALAQLRECSLLQANESGAEMRFRMLETLREFGSSLLGEEDANSLCRRHAEYFVKLAEETDLRLIGPDVARWMANLTADYDNIRTVLAWCAEHDISMGLHCGTRLSRFWYMVGYIREGQSYLLSALDAAPDADILDRAGAHTGVGSFAFRQTQYEASREHFAVSLALYRRAGNGAGMSQALMGLGRVAVARGDYEVAVAAFEEAVSTSSGSGDEQGAASALHILGNALISMRDFDRATAVMEESVAVSRRIGDIVLTSRNLNTLGEVERFHGNYERAAAFYEESLACFRTVGFGYLAQMTMTNLAFVENHLGNVLAAGRYLLKCVSLCEAAHDKDELIIKLWVTAGTAGNMGLHHTAALLLGAADVFLENIGGHYEAADKIEYERYIASTREVLGEREFEREYEQGREMTFDGALDLAKSVLTASIDFSNPSS